MNRPIAWARYVQACRAREVPIDGGLARFAARYHVATSFTELQFNNLGQSAVLGYTCAFRSGLAYSALESLDRALGSRRRKTPVLSAEVEQMFAHTRAEKLRTMLADELDDKKLISRLESIANGREHTEVAPLAAGVRHVVFHGGFTAYGSGAARSPFVRDLLDQLASATLLAADARFERHLDEQA